MRTGKKKIEYTLKQIDHIFNDELVSEVCQIYAQLVIDHELNKTSLNNLLIDYKELFEDYNHYGHYTWIALAYLQFELGLLTNEIKSNALHIIKNEIEQANRSIHTKLPEEKLMSFQELLNSPIPKKVTVRKPKYYKCPWKIGDVFAIKLDSNKEKYQEYGLHGKYVMCNVR